MIAFLIDADNFCSSAWVDEAFQLLEQKFGGIAIKRAYGETEKLNGLENSLKKHAVRPFVNLFASKNTTDMALAVDAMELACKTPHPSTIVIGSGDMDFLPLVVRLKERGIKMLCITAKAKISTEAIVAYDEVIYATDASPVTKSKSQSKKTAPAKKTASKVSAKSATPKSNEKPATKAVAPKKAATPAKNVTQTASTITVEQILLAAPALASGQWTGLSDVAKKLHDAKLLGKNTSSPKLFAKFPTHFELKPVSRPNTVRLISK